MIQFEVIKNVEDKSFDNFVYHYLPNKMLEYLALNLSEKRVSVLNKYLLKAGILISVRDALMLALGKPQVLRIPPDRYIVSVNPTMLIEGNIRLIQVIDLIEYGNLEVKGYPIVDEIYRYITTNMKELYKTYKEVQ